MVVEERAIGGRCGARLGQNRTGRNGEESDINLRERGGGGGSLNLKVEGNLHHRKKI